MTKKWIGINLLLLAIAAFAGYQLYDSVQQFEAVNAIENIRPQAQTGAGNEILPPPQQEKRYSPMDFAVISDKNVFSETRTKEESVDEPAVAGTLPDSQKPTLVGVIVSGKQKVATLLEPAARGQSGDTILKKLGETYQNYTITEIEADHIVLDGGDRKVRVELNDISLPAPTRRTVNVSTRVIPIGGGTASAGMTPVMAAPGLSRLGRTVPARNGLPQTVPVAGSAQSFITPVTTGVPGAVGLPGAAVQSGAVTPPGAVPQTSTQATPTGTVQQTTPTPAQNTVTPQGRTRIIRSPFGEIIRNQ
jgi:hypothetical protein